MKRTRQENRNSFTHRKPFIGRALALVTTLMLLTAYFYVLPVNAAANVTVTVDTNTKDGICNLQLGVTHDDVLWEQGNATAVSSAKSLLINSESLNNQHIMGWGVDNPEPSPGVYNWTTLDARVNLMRSIGGDMVITFCTAPGWMKTSGKDWNMDDSVADAHNGDFANLCAMIAQRYPDVKYFQVWNEFKGYWDNTANTWDYKRYTNMYNAVYDAVRAVRPDAKIGGFYLVITGDASATLGYTGGQNTFTPIDADERSGFNYWLTNKHGADFVCFDRDIKDFHNTLNLTVDDGLTLTWTYSKCEQDIRSLTNLPIMWSEYYDCIPVGGDQAMAVSEASIYYNMIKGDIATGNIGVKGLLWGPSAVDMNHYLFTDTSTSSGGQPVPHYNVFKAFHDYFAPGTQLYKATSSDPKVEVLSSLSKTMLINKYNASTNITLNGTLYTLSAYEVRVVDTPNVNIQSRQVDPMPLKQVKYWAYQLQQLDSSGAIDELVRQPYDMYVLEPTRTDWSNEEGMNFNTKVMVNRIKSSKASDGVHRKLVIAYIDIGQSENYRWYWQKSGWEKDWKPGNEPDFNVFSDPDWRGCYPVKFWDKRWKDIVIYGKNQNASPHNYSSIIDEVIKDGFDGIYLDWVEAFDNETVKAAANKENKDPQVEMIRFIKEMREYANSKGKPNLIIIQQNAGNICEGHPEIFDTVDGIGQEDTWYRGNGDTNWEEDGGYDIPADAQGTQNIMYYLDKYKEKGKPVFTIDYTVKHAEEVYKNSSEKGYIPYCSRTALSKLTTTPPPELNKSVSKKRTNSEKLQQRMQNAIALYIGQSKSFVNNKETVVDSTNPSVYPFIQDGRTLVPVRFISESLGAQVNWDGNTSTVTISLNGKIISMQINSNKISVDGTESDLEVPAQIVKGRTFIPLRALVEVLGKQVFWDDRGLIVISDSKNIFDPVSDKSLIDELVGDFTGN